MKFFSFAILSALATTLTTALPAPSQQCNPAQGQQYKYEYDLTGSYWWSGCTSEYLQIESGVVKSHGAYNFVADGSGYTYCGKNHANAAGAKAVDSQGNRYNLIEVSNGNYDSSYSYATGASDTVSKYSSKYKLVGHGQLANLVITYTYSCHYTWDPVNGFHEECKKNDSSFTCSG